MIRTSVPLNQHAAVSKFDIECATQKASTKRLYRGDIYERESKINKLLNKTRYQFVRLKMVKRKQN